LVSVADSAAASGGRLRSDAVRERVAGDAITYVDDPMSVFPSPPLEATAVATELQLTLANALLTSELGNHHTIEWASLARLRFEVFEATYAVEPLMWGAVHTFGLALAIGARASTVAGAAALRLEYGGLMTTDRSGSGAVFGVAGLLGALSGKPRSAASEPWVAPSRWHAIAVAPIGYSLARSSFRVTGDVGPALGVVGLADDDVAGPLWVSQRVHAQWRHLRLRLERFTWEDRADSAFSLCSQLGKGAFICSFAQITDTSARLTEVGMAVGVGVMRLETSHRQPTPALRYISRH
jgi:hypothetical protein